MRTVHTELLEIAFDEGGPENGPPVFLPHGWPDAPRGWGAIAAALHAKGLHTIAPYLRGSGPTRFLSSETPRVGAGVALAQGPELLIRSQCSFRNESQISQPWLLRFNRVDSAKFPGSIRPDASGINGSSA